jgi:hypothetical protein
LIAEAWIDISGCPQYFQANDYKIEIPSLIFYGLMVLNSNYQCFTKDQLGESDKGGCGGANFVHVPTLFISAVFTF